MNSRYGKGCAQGAEHGDPAALTRGEASNDDPVRRRQGETLLEERDDK